MSRCAMPSRTDDALVTVLAITAVGLQDAAKRKLDNAQRLAPRLFGVLQRLDHSLNLNEQVREHLI